tara:strand:- start:2680 stop:3123 length:444 start_codon:yes stop_codon:yes gene_type:complete
MATKLNLDGGKTNLGKKIVDIHQENEYTHVDNYKEGLCFGCFTKNVVGALVLDCCGNCAGKRGRETLLVKIKDVYYGMCYFCGKYEFNLEQINARLCRKCHRRVADVMKDYNKKGGQFGADPFWVRQRKKNGKDWKQIFSKNLGNNR